MNLINRGVVIIQPKEPFLDWVNTDPTLSSPISIEYLQQDCTAILVPDLDSLEDMSDYLESLKPMLFEMELMAWSLDQATWPEEHPNELFDAWFRFQVHSMVWDAVDAPVMREVDEETNLTGTWNVVSSPDFDDDYLYMEVTPYVTLRQEGAHVSGEFHVGLIRGSLSGRPDGDRILFSFEATDEMDPVNGAGTIGLQGERLMLNLRFHFGDEFTFECVPQKE